MLQLSIFIIALLITVASTIQATAILRNLQQQQQPSTTDLQQLYGFKSVNYNFSSSPFWKSREQAIAQGDFIPQNNIITGVNAFNGDVFVCVPRWRPGVPSTLNKIVTFINETTGLEEAILEPFPSWEANFGPNRLWSYVQSIFIDQNSGRMYVIDTGRENFFSANAAKDTINRPARLVVLDLTQTTPQNPKIVYQYTFSDEIFPLNSSFLNDIVVSPSTNTAFMSDTNVAGLGAVVVHNFATQFSRRFQDPKSTFANKSYIISINGIEYPNFASPVDGIALSESGDYLYYSPVEGTDLYQVNVAALTNPSSTFDEIAATVKKVLTKNSASDGLRVMPSSSSSSSADGDLVDHLFYGSNCENALYFVTFAPKQNIVKSQVLVEKDDITMQWLDTFARVDLNSTHSHLYFTTNRLQEYFVNTLDLNSRDANFRVYRLTWIH